MARERRTKEERQQARQVARKERIEFREKPKDFRQDVKSSEKYNRKRERLLGKVNARIEESEGRTPSVPTGVVDPGVKGKSITTVMKGTTTDRGNDGRLYTNPAYVEAYSNTASQEEVGNAVRTQIDYKISKGEIDNANIRSQANSIPTAGMQLAAAVANDPNATLTDLDKLPQATTAVNDVQSQQDAAIANQAVETNNAVSETPKSEMPAVGAEVAANEVANAEQGGTQPSERIGGDGSTALNQMQGGAATFDQGLTRQKVQDQVTSGALQGLSSSPIVAIEKLGIQDYFPNAGESINVGSYSGKYIGNTTIFAAPGARVPFGLYDARMRALKEAAVEKQKSIDAILTAPETSAQYQQQFNANFFGENGVQRFIDKHGNNPDAILNDPEFREWMADKQAKARDITQAVSVAKATLDEYAKTGSYIPDKVRDVSMKLLYGQADEFEKYLNGTGSLSKVVEDNLVYMNIFPQVQEYAKTALSPDRLTQSPINMKTGGKYESATFNKERNEFMSRVMDGSVQQGTDVYASGIAKYFTGDYESAIRSIAAGQNASEEQVEEAIKMFTGMIPKESIIFDYTSIKTDELEWAKHYQHIKEWNKEQQDEEMSFARTLDGSAGDMVNPKTGKTFNQEISDLAKSGLTGTARQRKLEEIYGVYTGSMSGSTVRTDKNGTIVTTVPLPDIKAVQGDPQKRTYAVTYKDMDGKQVKRNLTAADIARVAPNVKLYIGGKAIENNSDFATIMEKPVSSEQRKAFYDRNNKLQYLTADNVEEYDKAPAGRKMTFETERLQTYIVKTGEDAEGNTYQYYEPISGQVDGNVYNISNPSGQQLFDDRVGYTPPKAAEAQGGGQTTISSGSTRPQ
jgi:hypothetical protein